MDVNVTNKTDNKLFGRKEISARVIFASSTPKRGDIKAAVANKIAANPENCVLREVKSEFGAKAVKVILHSYEDKNILMKNEPGYILVREGLKPKPGKKKKEKKQEPPRK